METLAPLDMQAVRGQCFPKRQTRETRWERQVPWQIEDKQDCQGSPRSFHCHGEEGGVWLRLPFLLRESKSQIIMIIKNLYELAIKEAESSIQDRLKDEFANLKRYAKEITAPDEVCLSMARSNAEKPIIHCSVFLRDECSPSFEHLLSLDKFLDETERNYEGSGIEGWGDAMIDDLEKLKAKIQKRITRMKKAIAKELE